jgi:hypothetical protein
MNAFTRADALREELAASIPERFDDRWTGYSRQHLPIVRNILQGFDLLRNDADAIYFARSLDYVSARNVEVLRPIRGIDRFVPTSNEFPVGAESMVYRIYDAVGMAKIIGANVDDLPRVDVRGIEMSVRSQTIGVSYGWTQKELRTAQYSGSGLPTRKATIARDVVDRKEDAIKVSGDAVYNVYGILTHPNVPSVTAPIGDWANAATSAEEIVDDVIALVNAVYTQSKGNFTAAVLAMPYQLRMIAARKRFTAPATDTALSFIRQTFPDLTIVEVPELAAAGAGGTHVAMVGTNNPAHYAYERVMPFRELPPQARNLEMIVNCEAETAGVIVYQPLALAKMEGL